MRRGFLELWWLLRCSSSSAVNALSFLHHPPPSSAYTAPCIIPSLCRSSSSLSHRPSPPSSIIHAFPPPKQPFMLFQKQKRNDRMRPQPNKTRYPPPKHPPNTFNPINIRQQPHHSLRFPSTHNPRFDHIHRTAYCRCYKAGQERGAEMQAEIVREGCVRE